MRPVKKNLIRKLTHGLAILVIALWSSQGFAETQILNIRHWAAPDHTRVVIDTSEEAQYTVEKKDMMVSIKITDARYVKAAPRTITIRKPGIERITLTTPSEGVEKVDLYLTAHTETRVFRVKKIEEKPDRIVIDIILPEVEKKEQEDRERVKVQTKDKIVVIDPGHGGEDPGAVGQHRTYEKKVVLEISKKVRDKLNALEGYHAFLTREGDYYVSFKKRLKIAREYGADLFLSIHADAARSRQASGTSVYSLSLRSASSEAAKILARNENLADIVGGAGNGDATSDQSDPIILNMFQTNTMNSSRTFGNVLLMNMTTVNRIKFNSVQEAPFMVLKLPEVPSVLIETAYISNPKEEKKLRNRQFQNELADAIVKSTVAFLSSSPVKTPTVVTAQTQPGVSRKIEDTAKKEDISKKEEIPAKEETAKKKEPVVAGGKTVTVFYMVKRGESIDRIARRYHVNPALILKINGMKPKDPLYANRKIKIPLKNIEEKLAARTSKTAKAAATERREITTTTYVVKRGESLDGIAKQQGISLVELLKINQMKMKDTLYAGKKIKIPAASGNEPEAAPELKKEVSEKKATTDTLKYQVKRGDTLEIIARKHETTITALLKLNNMKPRDPLYAGKVIKIREGEKTGGSEKTAKKKSEGSTPRTTIYIVKRGDSLDAIARKHKTTISALKDLNQGKRLAPLYVDQRLKIPATSKM
ncbi:MAG: N-acetylmuramoyl-L-alanine amidase [Deltaproteobacteria bacterium]|nr:N-acetylmuramoyl-L-alanine amidase [Deltaproteobacteria bacterium]